MAQRAKAPMFWIHNRLVPQLCGAEGEGSQGGNNTGGNEGGTGSNSGGDGNGAQSGSGQGGSGGGQSATTETVSKAEYEALKARMSAADQAKAAAEKRVTELEGKDKSELEKAQEAQRVAEARVQELSKSQQDMLTSNAFLTVKDAPTWHNASSALALLDKSVITIGDDGKVSGMEAAVNKLKQEHPYLIKEAAAVAGDGKDGKGGKGGSGSGSGGSGSGSGGGASGSSNNGGGGGGSGPDRKALEKRFPALRGR